MDADRPAGENAGVLRHPGPRPGRARPDQPDEDQHRPELLRARHRQRRRRRASSILRTFQDNEKTIPTILTTSQKLSTGVDARNVRNIVLMRPINSMIEFKQIIGRGTRLFDGKDYFTIYDFVKAYEHFNDPEWDGEPLEPEPCALRQRRPVRADTPPAPCRSAVSDPAVREAVEPCAKCGEQPCVCKKPQGEDQAGRRQGAHHPAHDGDHLLEPGRQADVGGRVHRAAVWRTAGAVQGRRRTAGALEPAGYAQSAAGRAGGEGLWRGATGRDQPHDRRREERSLTTCWPISPLRWRRSRGKNGSRPGARASLRLRRKAPGYFWISCWPIRQGRRRRTGPGQTARSAGAEVQGREDAARSWVASPVSAKPSSGSNAHLYSIEGEPGGSRNGPNRPHPRATSSASMEAAFFAVASVARHGGRAG